MKTSFADLVLLHLKENKDKDEGWVSIGNIMSEFGDMIAANKATFLINRHLKNADKKPIDEQIFLGRRLKVTKTLRQMFRDKRIDIRGSKGLEEYKFLKEVVEKPKTPEKTISSTLEDLLTLSKGLPEFQQELVKLHISALKLITERNS